MLMVLFVLLASQVDAQSVLEPDQPGPYRMGTISVELVDESRDDRHLQVTLWYPADNTSSARPFPADISEAPYPLIMWSHGYGDSPLDGIGLVRHLVSRGYVIAGLSHPDQPDQIEVWDWPEVDRPLDDLFVLDQLAKMDDERLAGLMDTDNVGVIGFSWGATGALQVAGARVDPGRFLEWCETTPVAEQMGYCDIVPVFDQLQQYQEAHIPLAEDGLWSSTTDPRIRAIMAFSPAIGQEIGERGMAGVSVPVFISAATEDTSTPYLLDGRFMYDHLGEIDRYLLTLVGDDHAGIWRDDDQLVSFFAAAFLDRYLKGVEGSEEYLTPEAAEQFNNVTLEVGHTGG